MLSEITQSQKDKYRMCCLIYEIAFMQSTKQIDKRNQVHTYILTDVLYNGGKHTGK